MTEREIQIVTNLNTVHTGMGSSFAKRFIAGMAAIVKNTPEKELTESQTEWVYRMVYKYRRKIPKTYTACKSNKYCQPIKK